MFLNTYLPIIYLYFIFTELQFFIWPFIILTLDCCIIFFILFSTISRHKNYEKRVFRIGSSIGHWPIYMCTSEIYVLFTWNKNVVNTVKPYTLYIVHIINYKQFCKKKPTIWYLFKFQLCIVLFVLYKC